MTAKFHLADGRGFDTRARITKIGEVVVSDYSYWDVAYKLLDTTNTAYNFFGPKASQNFIITGIILRANKLVSATSDATVVIYEASSTTSTTESKVLFSTQIVESQIMTVMPIKLLVTEGFYVNGKTDDDDVSVNIFGFYVPLVE